MKVVTLTAEQKTANKLAQELKDKVNAWFDREFNFIQLDVLNKCCENNLFEYIRQPEITIEDLAEYEGETENKEWMEAQMAEYPEIEENPLYDKVRDSKQDENYPMWNTCFEFRYEPGEEMIQAAIKAGLGVIEGMEDFNTLLFASGCGYSFYGAHWIPMYLNFYENEAKKYKGVKYNHF